MVLAFPVCFESLPLLFRPTEGFIPPPPQCLGHWHFPEAPAKAPGCLQKALGGPERSGAAAVGPLPSTVGFDQFCRGCVQPDLAPPVSLRWKVLFSLSVASKALPPLGWDETDNGSHFVVL